MRMSEGSQLIFDHLTHPPHAVNHHYFNQHSSSLDFHHGRRFASFLAIHIDCSHIHKGDLKGQEPPVD
jgi:hypothetical protein